ncbi:MAG: response regulator [Myxococcota bacterium]
MTLACHKTLLIVDDSLTARLLAQGIVKKLKPDWTIISAKDGPDALRQLQQEPTELSGMLLDINMPHMDGFELASKLREAHPRVPIVMLSANVQRSNRERADSAGYGFIPKPVSPEKVGSFLETLA